MGASGEERVSGTQSGLAGLLVCHAVPPCDLTRTKLTQEIRTKPSCQARRGAADMVHSRDRPDHHVRPEARHRQQHAQAWLAAGVPGVHAVHRRLVGRRAVRRYARRAAAHPAGGRGGRGPGRGAPGERDRRRRRLRDGPAEPGPRPLLYAPGAERSRTLLWHVGVAALALAVLRAGGPLWVVVSVAALLLPLRWAKLRQLWAWRPVRWWMLVVGLAMVGSLIWTALFKTTNLGDFTHGQRLSLAQAIGTEVDIWREYADEMVGVMAWLDARMPGSMYLIWESAVAALLVWGFIVAHRAGRWRMAALAAGGLGIPFVMQIAYVNKVGFVTQGRYLLPVAVGLPILATFLIQEYGLPGDKSR